MLDRLIKQIQMAVAVEPVKCGDDEFLTRSVVLPPAEPMPVAIIVRTLAGLVDLIQAESKAPGEAQASDDRDAVRPAMIHVASPKLVQVLGSIRGRHMQRHVYYSAQYVNKGFPFSEWQDVETFIINAQTCFEEDEDRARLVKMVGNITDLTETKSIDDGVSQRVVMKTGIANVDEVKIVNPIILSPYRSFPEIAPEASEFIFRMRKGRGDQLECALFEVVGSHWEIDTMRAIKAFLAEKLGADNTLPIIE